MENNPESTAQTASPLEVLWEDHHYIAVNKPAGIATQAPAGILSLESQVKAYIKETYAKPAGVYLGIPHRLDRPVSGVVLFARNTKAASKIATMFQNHTVQKIYWALIGCELTETEGEWIDLIRKIPDVAKAELASSEDPTAKEAITQWKRIATSDGQTLLQLSPKTGRMHQLRLQAALRGSPIIGDELYGSPLPFGSQPTESRDRRIALLARSLSFQHPFRKTEILIEAQVPDYWPNWVKNITSSRCDS